MLQDLLSKFSSPAEKQGYLLQLTAAHPYFAPAQFCLLQTMLPGETEYGHRAAITNLLYNNAHWLQFQLAQSASPTIAAPPSPSTADWAVENKMDYETEAITEAPEISPATEGQEAPLALQHAKEEIPAAVEAAHPPAVDITIPAAENDASSAETSMNNMATGTTETTATDLIERETEAEPSAPPTEVVAPPAKEEMLFEPLFAVDYFASQGIKLSEEMQHSDKLGKQLKSFTEWLKSMKKMHSPSLPSDDLANEEDVQTIAEKSNTEDDVVTEAMAEVFALQGRKQKAAAIYRKLSLLNPHKSAYFAAKIENLK